MARTKTAAALDVPPTESGDGRLDQLTSTVDTLAQEVRILREAVDELREILDWTMKNRESSPNDPFVSIRSRPRAPLDNDFSENTNDTARENAPETDEQTAAAAQGGLFD